MASRSHNRSRRSNFFLFILYLYWQLVFSTTLITSCVLYAVPPFWRVPIFQSLGRHQLECEVKLLNIFTKWKTHWPGNELRPWQVRLQLKTSTTSVGTRVLEYAKKLTFKNLKSFQDFVQQNFFFKREYSSTRLKTIWVTRIVIPTLFNTYQI